MLNRLYHILRSRKRAGGASQHSVPEKQRLNGQFQQLAQRLKQAHFSRSDLNVLQRALRYLSRRYRYQLPWFVIIGAPAAGKTTALMHSGLPIQPAADLVTSAASYNGWYTHQAVLLETAAADAAEWRHIIALLGKYRRRQPINGVIITLSVTDLLTQNPEAARQHAHFLRQRLSELHHLPGMRFPVYMLVSKIDLLSGFGGWFATLDKAQREQIWGFTLPWPQAMPADFNLSERFRQEYALLQRRLETALPDILLREGNAQRRAENYLFPQQFAALCPRLAEIIDHLFSHADVGLRGVYFVSAAPERSGADAAAPVPGFFLQQLWPQVFLPQVGLTHGRRGWQRARLWLGYLLLLTLLMIGAQGWLTSYGDNRAWLQEVQLKLPQLEQHILQLPVQGAGDWFSLLPLLDALQQLPVSQQFDIHSPSLARRLGLYRGNEVLAAADLFHHRLTLLFYRAWAHAQPVVALDRVDNQQFARWVASLAGIRLPQQRSPLTIHARLASGRAMPRLGQSAFLGVAIRDVQHKFIFELGAMPLKTFQRFLPGQPALQQLRDWVKQYLGIEYIWQLRLILAAGEVKEMVLGGPAQLGLTSWLGQTSPAPSRGDLIFSPENVD